jgi:TrmH family RNA methyltransferase
MMEVTSSKNPLLKEIKALDRKKYRWEQKKFLVEGIKSVGEALETDGLSTKVIFTDSLASNDKGETLFHTLSGMSDSVYMPEGLFKTISNVENSQGVLATVNFIPKGIEEIPKEGILIYLDGLQDPGNLGTIIRSADAFGISGIVLGENCVDPYNPKVVRATMGSIFRVPLYFQKSNEDFFDQISDDRRILATSLDNATLLNSIKFSKKDVIVIGNEGHGVSDHILERSDLNIVIPMVGNAESLNAGVAASIIMYETSRELIK